MSINKTLKINPSYAQDDGFVGYDSNAIYRNIPGETTVFSNDGSGVYSKNGDRTKTLFSDAYTSQTATSIASRIHLYKAELEIKGDGLAGRIAQLEGTDETTGEIAILTSINENDPKIAELQNELSLLKQAENFLIDTTIENVDDTDIEVGQNDAYNPDFPAESISYMYRRQDFTSSERGSDTDGITSSHSTPNIAYPKTRDNSIVATPYKGGGGFGSSDSSLNQGQLSSLNIVKKYNPAG